MKSETLRALMHTENRPLMIIRTAISFIQTISDLPLDGELKEFVMDGKDAIETLSDLIREARRIMSQL